MRKLTGKQTDILTGTVMIITALIITIQSLGTGETPGEHYKNYLIFKNASVNLFNDRDLYQPDESALKLDFYKYSPTFALFMAPLSALPDPAGLFLWNLLNILLLFIAILIFPFADSRRRLFIWMIIFIEMITSVQNSQSNAMMAGLIILGFVLMEKKFVAAATLCFVLTFYIKIFGLAALALLLLYPGKIRSVAFSVLWLTVLFLIPVVVTGTERLADLYGSWMKLLRYDESVSYGLSVAGMIRSWTGLTLKMPVFILGVAGFFLPFLFIVKYKDPYYRQLLLSSILIWVVIFNFKAESPTFIIAVSGAAIWFTAGKRGAGDYLLLAGVLIFTVLSPTDIFPSSLRQGFFRDYMVKVIPCFLVWLRILYEMVTRPVGSSAVTE